MGGDKCAILGCSSTRSRCKGVSFFKLPKLGKGIERDKWAKQLVLSINRSDKKFDPNKARIFSLHFQPSCIRTGNSNCLIFILFEPK